LAGSSRGVFIVVHVEKQYLCRILAIAQQVNSCSAKWYRNGILCGSRQADQYHITHHTKFHPTKITALVVALRSSQNSIKYACARINISLNNPLVTLSVLLRHYSVQPSSLHV